MKAFRLKSLGGLTWQSLLLLVPIGGLNKKHRVWGRLVLYD